MGNIPKKYDLICVRWEDSRQPQAPWVWVDEYEAQSSSKNVTVGWLLERNSDCVVVAQSLGDAEEVQKQAGGITTISARAIVRIEILKPSVSCLPWACPVPVSKQKLRGS